MLAVDSYVERRAVARAHDHRRLGQRQRALVPRDERFGQNLFAVDGGLDVDARGGPKLYQYSVDHWRWRGYRLWRGHRGRARRGQRDRKGRGYAGTGRRRRAQAHRAQRAVTLIQGGLDILIPVPRENEQGDENEAAQPIEGRAEWNQARDGHARHGWPQRWGRVAPRGRLAEVNHGLGVNAQVFGVGS